MSTGLILRNKKRKKRGSNHKKDVDIIQKRTDSKGNQFSYKWKHIQGYLKVKNRDGVQLNRAQIWQKVKETVPVRSPLPGLQTSGRLMEWHRSTALALRAQLLAATVLARWTRTPLPHPESQREIQEHTKQIRSRGFHHCVTLEPSYEEKGPWWNNFLLVVSWM